MNIGGTVRQYPIWNCLILIGILLPGNAWGQGAFVTQYGLSSSPAGVQQITVGADGNTWFTESEVNMIAKITPNGALTEYTVPTPRAGLGPNTTGPDGDVWFGEIEKIGKITPDGNITGYVIAGSGPYGLAAGPDGNVWFTERLSSGAIGKITPDGKITEYALPNSCCVPGSIVAGPDGNLWFTEEGGCNVAKIGKITTGGAVTEFDVPFSGTGCMSLGRIRSGPDGNLWFVDTYRSIWRITIDGKLTQYSADPLGDLIQGPDGRMWFSHVTGNLGSITMDGIVSEHPVYPGFFDHFARGPDGSIWASTTLNSIAKIALPTCSYTLSASKFEVPAAGGTFQIRVQTEPSCAWSTSAPLSTVLWITLQDSQGTGPGSMSLTIAQTTASSRSAILNVAGVVFTVSQAAAELPPCPMTMYPGGQVFPASGGTGSIAVSIANGCGYTKFLRDRWITDLDGGTFSHAEVVNYAVAPNPSSFGRTSLFSIGVQTFVITQQGTDTPGLNLVGSMPHIAALGDWSTSFTVVNKSMSYPKARFRADDDSGNPLQLPFVFPEPSWGPTVAASFDRSISPKASLVVNTAESTTTAVQVGAAQLASDGAIDGFAIFQLLSSKQEAVVPLETRNSSSYLLAFDHTEGVVSGVAVQNVSGQSATIPVVIRDDTGAVISPPGTALSLAASGHTSFLLSEQYPFTANKRGTVEFDTPAGGRISVLGVRTTPLGSSYTLTTIPALADIGTNGGSIAHIATGAGWQTTFVLVNAGTRAAQAHLKFFATGTGAQLFLPVTFPQSPGGASTVVSTADQTLAAGASLIVESAASPSDPAPTIGSAQLTTDGNVGGFVIFRYNPTGQEAVVPLESRTSVNGFLIAFDNTAGVATGIAVNNASSSPVKVPVIVRDDFGNQIATDALNLAPNGHVAFTLALDRYTITANKRGTIEFIQPSGGQIGALGIRVSPAGTITTLPALVE